MTPKRPIYLDSNATTPVDPRVLEKMLPYFCEDFGNAASIDHAYGANAGQAIRVAREQVARSIGAKPEEIIFTSGATESDNLAIAGAMGANQGHGNHIITSSIEHKAVLDTCKRLERCGCTVTYLPVDAEGLVDPKAIEAAITEKTVLISIMVANNEVGTIEPINEIGKVARKHGVLFHTDAAQAVGHMPIDVKAACVDLMSISAHKTHGPKGVGALFVKSDVRAKLAPLIMGGGHERGLRSGTLNVPGIVGLGECLSIADREREEENKIFKLWTAAMFDAFNNKVGDVKLNGHQEKRLPHNLNVEFCGIEGKALIHLLREEVAFSSGSACTSTSVEPSHVLLAMGRTPDEVFSSVRFGVSRVNHDEEISLATEYIIKGVTKLRRLNIPG